MSFRMVVLFVGVFWGIIAIWLGNRIVSKWEDVQDAYEGLCDDIYHLRKRCDFLEKEWEKKVLNEILIATNKPKKKR